MTTGKHYLARCLERFPAVAESRIGMDHLERELESVVNECLTVVRFTSRYWGVDIHGQTIRK